MKTTAAAIRGMSVGEREWVLQLVNLHGQTWEAAAAYVLSFRANYDAVPGARR